MKKILIIEYKWKTIEYVKKNTNEKYQMLQRLICHIDLHIFTISCINMSTEIVFNSLCFLSSLIVFDSCVI